MKNNKLIGLYGGAFDPIHVAHLCIAENCINKIGLDKVIFVPTGMSPKNKKMLDSHHRLQMLKLACKNDYYEISDFEINQYLEYKKLSYTIDTLKFFYKNTDNTYLFILGRDSLASINSWHQWNDIIKYSHLLLIERNTNDFNESNTASTIKKFIKKYTTENISDLKSGRSGYIYKIQMRLLNSSSTDIKNKLANNIGITNLVTKEVEKYINQNKLYKLSGQTK
jgi:nicotinate-nucleotide adenylyltransferase